jgi:twitching motility protein PilT
MISIKELLNKMIDCGASDLHIAVGVPPMLRISGVLEPVNDIEPLKADDASAIIYSVLNDDQIREFESEKELDMSFGVEGLSRFRVNVFRDRGSTVAAFRAIPWKIFAFDDLGLPRIVADLSERIQGLVLVCGATGSGKSTTLAAIVDRINTMRAGHIITVEDPIEFLHQHKRCVVNQREVRSDTSGFGSALRYILRQDPDVVLIGEMRDLETIQAAITIAETGHLVFATLHTNDAAQSINRMIDVFAPEQQGQIRTQLSLILEGVIVQQLVPTIDGASRVLALEIMLATPAIRSLIRDAKVHQIYGMIGIGGNQGMMTMNQSLNRLYKRGLISYDESMRRSQLPEELKNIIEKTP